MSDGIDLGEDSGFADVTIDGKTVRVDLLCVYQEILEIEAAGLELTRLLIALAERLGFGAVSGLAADRFGEAVINAVRGLKKNAAAPSASPGSAGSTAATSAP